MQGQSATVHRLDQFRSAKPFRLPGPSERTMIIGRTGSGKSTFLLWLLSHADFERRPWIIVDYKREVEFARMKHNRMILAELRPGSAPPKRPGLYLIRPMESDDDAMDEFFWRIWRRGRTGLVFDECAWPPSGRGSAVRAILQQGRSLRIPVMAGNQRPVDLGDRNFLEQADYFAVFQLNNREDRRVISQFAPIDPDTMPPPFHAYWYDVKRDQLYLLTPVPQAQIILGRIGDRTPRRLFG